MKPFIFEQWSAWQGVGHFILSDDAVNKLHYFKTPNDCVNWLFIHARGNGDKPAARALNAHMKGSK